MHEYHVDVQQSNGTTEKYRVNVEDENHHSNWDDTWKFLGHVATLIGVSTGAVKAAKWIKKL